MNRRVLTSLIYIGRSREWLAKRLGISERTLNRRLADEATWTLQELRIMKQIFGWESIEG